MDGAADVAETTYVPFQSESGAAPVRLIVRRVKPTPGSQLALFATYSYHGFITDRDGDTLELEADHRRHAEVENAIRDLKYGMHPAASGLTITRFPTSIDRSAGPVRLQNPLPCHIGPIGAQAFSLVGSLIPICPAFTLPSVDSGLITIRIANTDCLNYPAKRN